MNQPIISVNNLQKKYQYYKKAPGFAASFKALFHREKLFTEAVKRVNFSLHEGELVGFLGPNGAGKTTTLKMLSGILYPTSGEVKVLGYTPWDRKPEFQKQFSLVMGQKNQLWWDLPALDTFSLNKEIYQIPDKIYEESLEELSSLLDARDFLDVPVRKLSLGQRMKCELIAALLHRPKVLFLDEPTIGLDVTSQENIRNFIKKYNQNRKTTIILTSHYMDDIKELCRRVIIINLGKIVYDGNLEDLINKHADYKLLTMTFTKDVERSSFQHYGTVEEYHSRRVVLQVPHKRYKEISAQVLSVLPVDDIFISEVKLEDVIRDIFSSTR